jgi:hypothetical protein
VMTTIRLNGHRCRVGEARRRRCSPCCVASCTSPGQSSGVAFPPAGRARCISTGQRSMSCAVGPSVQRGGNDRTSENRRRSALRAAWLDVDVVQCGYCQRGSVTRCAPPTPSDSEMTPRCREHTVGPIRASGRPLHGGPAAHTDAEVASIIGSTMKGSERGRHQGGSDLDKPLVRLTA